MKSRFENEIGDVWSALTDPQRLARWYGKVGGDLRVGGVFTSYVRSSEWNGQGRVNECVSRQRLEVTMWEEEGKERNLAAELIDDASATILMLEVRGLPIDLVWAYGAGWHVHLEDLATHLSGGESLNPPERWDELEPLYRAMTVVPL